MRRKIQSGVTLADIARFSHVSEASVSAVLNGSRNIHVSAATRERILANARALNYLPPVISPSLEGPVFIGIIGGQHVVSTTMLSAFLQKYLLRHGYNTVVAGMNLDSLNQIDGAYTSPENLIAMGARALICLTDEISRERISSLSIPFVMFGQNAENCDIFFDKIRAFKILLEHLREKHGKTHPLFVGVRHKLSASRIKSGLGALDAGAVSLWDLDGDADRLFAEVREHSYDVLVASNDHVALKLIKAGIQRGFRIPEELAVIGYDGLTAGDDSPVSLTSAMYSISEAGKAICGLLFDRLAGKRTEQQHLEMPVMVHYGHSCGCPEKKIQRLFVRNTFALLELDALENFNENPEDCGVYDTTC